MQSGRKRGQPGDLVVTSSWAILVNEVLWFEVRVRLLGSDDEAIGCVT